MPRKSQYLDVTKANILSIEAIAIGLEAIAISKFLCF